MAAGFYRFQKTRVERMSIFKGNDSWYAISDERGAAVTTCHVIGSCLGGTSTFHASPDDPCVLFRLEPRRKFLNLTWFVREGETGPPIATIELFKSRGLKVLGPHGREVFRVVDPKGAFDKIMQSVLDGVCTEYAVVADDAIIGRFERRERLEADDSPPRGLLGRLRKGIAKIFDRDWCVDLDAEGKQIVDPRPLLAALILLMEQTITRDQAS